MKKSLLILIVLVILISGCSAVSVDAEPEPEPLPTADGAKEITMMVVDFDADYYEKAVKAFEKQTGIKVNIINYDIDDFEDMGGDLQIETLLQQIQIELMAGRGVDIYSVWFLDYNALGKQNLVCNMAGWIQDDPEVDTDAYYMPIVESLMAGDSMYALPLSFEYNGAVNSTVPVPELEGQENLSWEAFFEITQDLDRSGPLLGFTDYELFKKRFNLKVESFIDVESETQNLNSADMIRLLEQCRDWSEKDLCIPYIDMNDTAMAHALFQYGSGIYSLSEKQILPYINYYDMPSDDQDVHEIYTINNVCVNAASEAKGTAWAFVKCLMSEKMQSLCFWTPVNKKASEIHVSNLLGTEIEVQNLAIDKDLATKEITDAIDSIDDVAISYARYIQPPIHQIVFDEAKRYFKGEISAEEAAQKMAETVNLYFKEQ